MSATLNASPQSSALLVGAFCGGAAALLCFAVLHYCVSASQRAKAVATVPPLPSRRERAELLLAEMRSQREKSRPEAPSSAPVAAEGGATAEGDSSSEWSSTGTGTSSDDEEEAEDSEYERMDDLRLKMVFVVRHPVQPKMSGQEVAVLTASAGVQLIEMHQEGEVERKGEELVGETKPRAGSSGGLPFAPSPEDRQRWFHWYLWWNRIGCAKITLKCPESAVMEGVVAAAVQARLPIVQLRRSDFESCDGLMVQRKDVVGGDEAVVLALGPAPSDTLEPITGALKLFS